MVELYNKEDGEDYITFFDDGTVGASTHSYEISSSGYIELSKEDARKMYEAMRKFYGD